MTEVLECQTVQYLELTTVLLDTAIEFLELWDHLVDFMNKGMK